MSQLQTTQQPYKSAEVTGPWKTHEEVIVGNVVAVKVCVKTMHVGNVTESHIFQQTGDSGFQGNYEHIM